MSARKYISILLVPFFLVSLACQAAQVAWLAPVTSSPTASPTTYLVSTSPPAITLVPTPTSTATPVPPSPSLSPTLTETPVPASPTLSPTPTVLVTPSALQAKVFEELWTAVNKNYLYRDFNGLDWNAIHTQYAQQISAGMTDQAFYQAMHELIDKLNDNHSSFFSPSEAKEIDAQYTGEYNYVGIGVLAMAVPERQRATLALVFPGSPAEEAGLQMHDNILTIDGQPALLQGKFQRNLILGPEGTTVELTVQTPGQEPRQVLVTRRRIDSQLPVPHSVMTSPDGLRIGYVYLPTFNDEKIDPLFQKALEEMTTSAPLDGLILDNRQNGGGSSTVVEPMLSYFTNGVLGYFVDRNGRSQLSVAGKDIYGSQKIPLVVLVGKGTASFGEIFSGILKDVSRAYIIGEKTEGNVEILSIFNFTDGSRAWIAQMTFRPVHHPDQVWEGIGITPDLTVISNWDEVTSENDPVIQAALAHFDEGK